MVNVSADNKIQMTRGDSLVLALDIKNGDETYVPDEGDVIRFAMGIGYKSEPNYHLILTKDIPLATLVLKLDPEDTESLDYRTYNYDIELTKQNGYVDTFISNKITLTKEVE